ncbi:RNA polymerase sigma factor [Chitinophaga lutea]
MQKNNETDQLLLSRVAAGDTQAFGRLMELYHPVPYQTALRLLDDTWQAEDVVQEIFLKVWLNRDRLGDILNFRAWLITVTTRQVYDHLRSRQRETEQREQWQRELNVPAETEAPSELAELVHQAKQRLSPKQLTAFSLIKEQGYSRDEAAGIMQISPETVKTHLELAMRSIRAFCLRRLDPGVSALVMALLLKKIL